MKNVPQLDEIQNPQIKQQQRGFEFSFGKFTILMMMMG
jgi:hypothetical protein